jgi:CysZ protein
MIRAFLLSLLQLGTGPFLRVFAKSIAVTLLLFAGFGTALWWIASRLASWAIGWRGEALTGALAVVLTLLVLWLAFRAVAVAVVGVFADEVVEAVEARHYPAALATARAPGVARSVEMGVASAGRFIGVNLLLLPAYLLLLATGIGTPALFFAANAWLLGRDMGDMVAVRHLARADLPAWRRGTRAQRFLLGLAGTGMFVVPGLNLVAPVLAAAMATHLFHGARR